MQPQQIKGTTDWAEHAITLAVHPDARQLVFGVLLAGTGRVWADDLRLLVDGKPVWEAPKAVRPKTPLDLDRDFDTGSGVVMRELTPVQIANLVLLGKVWGFLKYHHPAVTTGTRHWDYELFRVLPAVLAAREQAQPARRRRNRAARERLGGQALGDELRRLGRALAAALARRIGRHALGDRLLELGDRVGIPWLGYACGECAQCRSDHENLCPRARFIGYQLDGTIGVDAGRLGPRAAVVEEVELARRVGVAVDREQAADVAGQLEQLRRGVAAIGT